jgi:hypothetical protein
MDLEMAASAITHVFNPALVAAFAFLVFLYPYNSSSPILVGISLTFGTVIPLGVVILMTKRGLVSDFLVSNKDERTKPFTGAVLSYLAGSFALWSMGAPKPATALMLCQSLFFIEVFSCYWSNVDSSGPHFAELITI